MTEHMIRRMVFMARNLEVGFQIEYTPDPDEYQIHLDFPKGSPYLTEMHSLLRDAVQEAIGAMKQYKER